MSSALSEKLSERASAALASSIFAATVARVDLAIAPISRSSPSSAPRPAPVAPVASSLSRVGSSLVGDGLLFFPLLQRE